MQVGEMHFFSPSGCSFFGKRRLRTHELVRRQLRVIVRRYLHTSMQCVFLVFLCVCARARVRCYAPPSTHTSIRPLTVYYT